MACEIHGEPPTKVLIDVRLVGIDDDWCPYMSLKLGIGSHHQNHVYLLEIEYPPIDEISPRVGTFTNPWMCFYSLGLQSYCSTYYWCICLGRNPFAYLCTVLPYLRSIQFDGGRTSMMHFSWGLLEGATGNHCISPSQISVCFLQNCQPMWKI